MVAVGKQKVSKEHDVFVQAGIFKIIIFDWAIMKLGYYESAQ